MRTIMERLECSFARQEAKLDKLLSMTTSVPAASIQHQTPQYHPPPPQFSTPDTHPSRSVEYPVQVQSLQRNADYPMQFPPMQRTPLPDVDTLLNDAEFTGNYYLNSIVYKIGAADVHAKERTDERTIGNTWLFIIAVSFAKFTIRRFIYPYKFQLTINHLPTKVTQKF